MRQMRFSVLTSEHVCASAATMPTLYSSHLVPIPTSSQRQVSFRCLGLLFKCAGAGTGSSVLCMTFCLGQRVQSFDRFSHHARLPSLTISKGFPRTGVRWKTWRVRTDRASASNHALWAIRGATALVSLTSRRFSLDLDRWTRSSRPR